MCVLGVLFAILVAIHPPVPKHHRPKPMAAERSLTDAEVEEKWNAQVDAAERGLATAKQGASDAWDAAKSKLKRMWIEGQKQK